MQYILGKQFEKDFAKLPKAIKLKVIDALTEFTKDPGNPNLRVHSLKGKWVGHLSIDVTGDTRAIYCIIDKGLVRFVAVGSHSQLYG